MVPAHGEGRERGLSRPRGAQRVSGGVASKLPPLSCGEAAVDDGGLCPVRNAKSRQSSATSQAAQTFRAAALLPPFSGKKMSTSTCATSERSEERREGKEGVSTWRGRGAREQ